MTPTSINFTKGLRLKFIWKDGSYTPGTVDKIVGNFIIVKWDDKKVTKASADFYNKFCIEFNTTVH